LTLILGQYLHLFILANVWITDNNLAENTDKPTHCNHHFERIFFVHFIDSLIQKEIFLLEYLHKKGDKPVPT